MKPIHVVAIVLAIVAFAAYLLGRTDSSDNVDIKQVQVAFQAYGKLVDSLSKELQVIEKQKQQSEKEKFDALMLASAAQRRSDSLFKTRKPLPALVPAACEGWAFNLKTCDEEKKELNHSLAATREALDATANLQLLAQRKEGIANMKAKAAEDRATKAEAAAKHLDSKNKFLGITLPSRKTSFAVGGVAGALITLLLTRH